jgi:hypothetical protein
MFGSTHHPAGRLGNTTPTANIGMALYDPTGEVYGPGSWRLDGCVGRPLTRDLEPMAGLIRTEPTNADHDNG